MKTWFFVLILGLSFTPSNHGSYFPDGYGHLYLGMPADSLVAKKGIRFESSLYLNGKRQYVETPLKDTIITKVMYLMNDSMNLYEVIFEYKDHFNLELYMNDRYGPANTDDGEWLFTLADGREIHIWNYLNRLCIADGNTYK